MSIDNFIPTLWAGKLLENLNNAHVAVNCLTREYEGDIKNFGDSVKINSIGRVTISTYTKNTDINAPEALNDSQVILLIDQGKYFNFQIDDADAAQQKPKVMQAAMREAAWGLADVADQYAILMVYNGVATATPDNLLASRSLGTGAADDDAYETLVDLGVLLDESNCPSNDRWVWVPPWVHGMLLKDPRFVSFGTPENIARLKGGAIGEAANFTIYKSNNIYPALSSAYAMIAGYQGCAAFAEQILDTEAYRPERRFADAVKGLHVYGGKVLRPYTIAVCPVTQA